VPKTLVCSGKLSRLRCKLDGEDLTPLPADNIKFDLSTINNLSEVKNDYKKGSYYIEVKADENSEIVCHEEWGKYGLEIRCKAIGERTADYPEIWETITELDEMREIRDEESRKKAYKLFKEVLGRSFPDIKDKVDFLKPFEVPKLEKYGVGAYTKLWIDEQSGRVYPLVVGYNPETTENLAEDETAQKLFLLDTIHELTHVARAIEGRYKTDVGEEEGETYTEALVRGDWAVRVTYPLPHGEVEEIIYVRRCILPKQYCFETLKDAREFEEFNYELVTGREKPEPVTPEAPDWSEVEKRLPVAPIVDMIRGMKNSYNVLTDVHEYWVEVTSPTGKKYLYKLADLHVDGETLDFMEVLDLIDDLDAIKNNEDIEKVWDYP